MTEPVTDAASLAAALPAYFAWRDDPPLVATLQETLVTLSCDRFARCMQWLREVDEPAAEALIARTAQLPDASLMRVLTAPETGYRLGHDGRDAVRATASYLDQVLSCEEHNLGLRASLPGPCWSALGDRYEPGPTPGIASDNVAASATNDPNRRYRAPVIDGIVIDLASPNALGKLPEIAGGVAPIAPDAADVAVQRITAALDLIRRGNAGAVRMLTTFTTVIVVRSDPTVPDFYTSASTTLCLRRPVLRNPFVASATVSEIADGLVHEAIHCVCDLSEMRDGAWLPDRETHMVRLASPWTGRSLDLHTYLQACWVWYGLWNFWLSAITRDAVEIGEGLRCLGRAYRGFDHGVAVARLGDVRGRIRRDVGDALAEAQASVWGAIQRFPAICVADGVANQPVDGQISALR